MRVVFVCAGNICRSPYAEAVARRDCAVAGVEFASAGLSALSGNRATAEALAVASERGVDLSGHRAQPLTPELEVSADLVVDLRERVFDPYGGGESAYRSAYDAIDIEVASVLEGLRR